LPICQLADKSQLADEKLHSSTTDAKLLWVSASYAQARVVGVVGMRSQAVISGFDDKYVARLIGDVTSLLVS